jgi:hypothetical protein
MKKINSYQQISTFVPFFLIMEAERGTFFRRARLQREDVRNHVRTYNIADLESYVLHQKPEHYRYYDNRNSNI